MTWELIHDYLFLTPHFPIFLTLQVLLYCVEVRRRNPLYIRWKSFVISALSCFLGQSLIAWITKRDPPILNNPYYIPIFLILWFLVNISPLNCIYNLLTSQFFSFLSQILVLLIQIRQVTHGVDIGFRYAPNSIFGPMLFSFILSSSECVIWNIFIKTPSRYFGVPTLLRNIVASGIYILLIYWISESDDDIGSSKDLIRLCIFFFCGFILLINCFVNGINSGNAFDITLLSIIFHYKGGNNDHCQIMLQDKKENDEKKSE